ncbi:MAG: elongation factor G [Oscillospiraceae bacterium]|nr:elongation factor G [Oscillospiraceae bacterium]
MATIKSGDIRNICLLGHGGSGKTSLAEAMLYYTKGTDRLGKTTDGNTVCDYDSEEIKRKYSISASIAPVMIDDKKINFIDTPGFLDFAGEVKQAVSVCENAMIVINAKSGLEVGAELCWNYASEAGVSKSFFINRLDEENINFESLLVSLKNVFGTNLCPVFVPIIEDNKTSCYVDLINLKAYVYDKAGKASETAIPAAASSVIEEYKSMLFEALAETSENMMEKFFGGEEFTHQEIIAALNSGINSKSIVPVFSGSASTLAGIDYLLTTIAKSFPNPIDSGKLSPTDPASIFVYKTVADPFVGKMNYFKVMSGSLKRDDILINSTTEQPEKFAHIYIIKGKKQTEVDELACGDLGVTAKLVNTNTNDSLSINGKAVYKKIEFPVPYLCMSIEPKDKGDEDKISSGITKLLEEDLTVRYANNAETKQMLIYGLGEMHLDVLTSKLKNRFGTSVDLGPEKIAYRETIKKTVQSEGKHKKQSGGHGQYGHVKIEFGPGEEPGLTFTETVFGGAVPRVYFPAVEKGLLEAMQKGVLAGYPVVNLKANLYDGSYHDVDSNELSFKLAASLAYKDGLKKANPVILEPIGILKVFIPDSFMGDIIGDINKRRGKVLGMNPDEKRKGYSIVEAEVPKAEMSSYTVQLRAVTQGRGSFTYDIDRYAEAPANVSAKIIESAKVDQE